jgi:hypothetical protein
MGRRQRVHLGRAETGSKPGYVVERTTHGSGITGFQQVQESGQRVFAFAFATEIKPAGSSGNMANFLAKYHFKR